VTSGLQIAEPQRLVEIGSDVVNQRIEAAAASPLANAQLVWR
jgi:hypothetical protein